MQGARVMVKRYEEIFNPNYSQECICHRRPMTQGLEDRDNGSYVEFEDYEKLQKQLNGANELVKELESQLKRLIDYEADQALIPEASYQGTQQLVNDIKNDATDVGGCYEVSCGLLDSLFWHYTDKGASKLLNKFAIEKKCEGYYDSCIESGMNGGKADLLSDIYAEQLRKEQE